MVNSKFLKVNCPSCENESVLFSNSATTVNCELCGSTLATSAGGRARVIAKVVEELE
ncbi:MAG: 30S ribosomal protein S27e [Candidatus Poseidoniia archaeon]|jgi:small subunit ribosomal protein S27e|nr:30S ribosomal protein S27e [Candidatus Poseidoniia archaeon]MEC7930177.1 30S ribosomal protein S27e [Candidatus Thermoplasmatota archaeon]MDP6275228.1 30S ribosomal protein S27e [Candidatus Poseidoniia archaeon]MDP7136641.1 30S ribosomal protein S27e [Candidatus Poseidoniia archaeon]MDP7243378.1 30S ribosomal protein S27e [Candidatus Poseidoniia archaeon]|tara:strand:+ start:160 stop:330 length:171 start_codon:yes stop_codon:yes gene_type:complete